MLKFWKSLTEWFTSVDEVYEYVENQRGHILYGVELKKSRNQSRGARGL